MRLLALVILAGCFHPTAPAGAPCNSLGECPTGLTCSLDRVCVDGTPTTDDAGASDAAIDACPLAHCEGDNLVGCGTAPMACANGCVEVGAPHCAALVPSNGVLPTLLAGATAELTGSRYDFDGNTGRIRNGGITVRASGQGVISGIGFTIIDGNGVFSAQRFDMSASAAWNISGSVPVVLYAATTIAIAGALDVGGGTQSAGPGGRATAATSCDGGKGTWTSAGFGDGGGGAGGASAGASGGSSNGSTRGAGGLACAQPSTIPLEGGNAGGAGGVDSTGAVLGGHAGGGGGALALVAMESITIASGGAVGSPGGGGESLNGASDGGGGGGGGGAVLLEAPIVTVAGALTANGGAGGAPSAGADGARGYLHGASAAPGGVYMMGSGGSGGARMAPPTMGTAASDATPTARGGGGGGAVGRTEIRSRVANLTGGVFSPPAAQSMAVVQ